MLIWSLHQNQTKPNSRKESTHSWSIIAAWGFAAFAAASLVGLSFRTCSFMLKTKYWRRINKYHTWTYLAIKSWVSCIATVFADNIRGDVLRLGALPRLVAGGSTVLAPGFQKLWSGNFSNWRRLCPETWCQTRAGFHSAPKQSSFRYFTIWKFDNLTIWKFEKLKI